MDLGQLIRDPAPFMPHGMCLLWDPRLIWLHLGADILTALAYYSIPIAIFVFVRKRDDLAFGWVFVLFGLFIAACGTTHAMGAWTLWNPDYVAQGMVKAATAAVSLATAVVLWPLLPKALALPSPAQLRAANGALKQEISDRIRAEARVREANAELERRVAERTAELAAANARLEDANARLEQRVEERTAALLEAIQALKESEARQAVILDNAADGIFLIETDDAGEAHLVDANPALAGMMDLDLPAVRGRRLADVFPGIVMKELAPRLSACIAGAAPVAFEMEVVIAGRRRVLLPALTRVADPSGPVRRVVGTLRDMTEQRALEAELAQSAKLATLGSMAAGVAHEVSQPLNAIRITAADCHDIVTEDGDIAPDQDALRYVGEGLATIRDQAERMGGIIDQLRLFGRRDSGERLFDPVQPVRRALTLLERHFASTGIRIDHALPDSLPPVTGKPAQLEQVMLNLLTNGRDAIEEARASGRADAGRIVLSAVPEDDCVILNVSDDGIGISQDAADRIFEPFFTTKEEQNGMGLGLSICSTIVNSMGGRITARPLDRGVHFSVTLPVARAQSPEESKG